LVQIPTVVDLSRYPVHPMKPIGPLRVGWIGTPATTKYLQIIRDPLRKLNQITPLTFVTVGASSLLDFGVPLEQHPWNEESEAGILSTFDIGIMPLPDEPWERGKCGYKLIQYMACARAVVASPVGVNKDIVMSSVGRLASTSAEWMLALADLASDRQRLSEMGSLGRQLIAQKYSIESMAPVVVQTLKSATLG
jgi:glycosyltransferase involved in cell wall biosynthesis